MGCATSKAKQSKCRHCEARKRPFLAAAAAAGVSRSYSMFVHHPPSKAGDSYHVVALTSTTLGSLPFNASSSSSSSCPPRPHYATFNGRLPLPLPLPGDNKKSRKAVVDMREAKAWSKMIDEKILDNRGEPETINAWEMMEGLEDTDTDTDENENENDDDSPGEGENDDCVWSGKEVGIIESDGEVISALRKALAPTNTNTNTNPFPEMKKKGNGALEMHLPIGDGTNLNVSIEKEEKKEQLQADENDCCDVNKKKKKEKLVLYLTSLRGIRKTYEDCCDVKLILKGLGVRVDERDVSMHSAFKEELRDRLRLESHKDKASGGLPRVFVGDKYIGGADDIRRMDEEGCLSKALQPCEFLQDQPSPAVALTTCNACADIRFIPCETCSGSCKVYYHQVEDDEADEFGFQRCPDCNENGLIRCPICCH